MRSVGSLLLILCVVAPAQAQPAGDQASPPARPVATVPHCTAELEGQLSCQANRQCRCRFAPAVKARGLPARWAWDCSIKRPQCVVTPESLAPQSAINPDVHVIEHEDAADRDAGHGPDRDTEKKDPPQRKR